MNYPVRAIEPRGFTDMLQSEAYWASFPIGFIGIYRRRITVLVFYAKDGNKWQLRSIVPSQPIPLIHRLFRSTEPVRVLVELQPAGPYSTDELRAALKSAVQADDDILCQYHAKEQILKWLDEAKSIPRIFNLYNWITKEFPRRKGERPSPGVAPN